MTEKKKIASSDNDHEDTSRRDSSPGLLGGLSSFASLIASPFLVANEPASSPSPSTGSSSKKPPIVRQAPVPAAPQVQAPTNVQMDPKLYERYMSIVQNSGTTVARFLRMAERLAQKHGDPNKGIQAALDAFDADESLSTLRKEIASAEAGLNREHQQAQSTHTSTTQEIQGRLQSLDAETATEQAHLQNEIQRLTAELGQLNQQLTGLPAKLTSSKQALNQELTDQEAWFASIELTWQTVANLIQVIGGKS